LPAIGSVVFTTIISIAARATTQRATALSAGDPPPRQRSQTTMSPLVLDGYPTVMRQPIRSDLFRAAPTAG
jgi:hypothetical protein